MTATDVSSSRDDAADELLVGTRAPPSASSSASVITIGSVKPRRPLSSTSTILREPGQLVAHGERLVELLLVLDDHDLGLGVAEEVLDLGRRARRVDADGDATDALDAEVGEQPRRRGSRSGWRPGRPSSTPSSSRPRPMPAGAIGVLGPRVRAPAAELLLRAARRRRGRCGPRASRMAGSERPSMPGRPSPPAVGASRVALTRPPPGRRSMTSGSACTCSGGPVAMTRPKSRTITRSAMSMTMCMSCSTRIMARSSWALISRM